MTMSLLAWLLLLAAPYAAQAFYLPGIAPTDYKAGSPMNVKVRSPPHCPFVSRARALPARQRRSAPLVRRRRPACPGACGRWV